MVVNQIYSVINSASEMAWGEAAVAVQDLEGLIALGDKVLSSSTDTDAWLGALCDRIAETVVTNKKYTPKTRGLKKTSFEYGAAKQEIYVFPIEASENAAWKIDEANDPVPVALGNHTRPQVAVEYFENFNTFKFTISVPDYQLKSAFTNAGAMAAFISGIFTEFENGVAQALEDACILCEANFIAEKFLAELDEDIDGQHVKNVLHDYNTLTNESLTEETCWRSAGFLKYAGQIISDLVEAFAQRTVLFNANGFLRSTAKEDIKIHLLAKVAAAYKLYLESDTFNKDLVALPGYETVDYFQGIGDNTLEDCSTIKIATASDGTEVTQNGVFCVMFDPEAMGVMFEELKSDSFYDMEHDLTKYWKKITQGYFNKLGHNAIVLYAANDENDYIIQNTPEDDDDDDDGGEGGGDGGEGVVS